MAVETTPVWVSPDQIGSKPFRFKRDETKRLVAIYVTVGALGIVAWVTFLHYRHQYGSAYASGGALHLASGSGTLRRRPAGANPLERWTVHG